MPPSAEPPVPAKPEPPIKVTLESKAEIRISLPLKPIMQGLPPFQIDGDAASVPAEAQVELPFSLIEPQLASGRIAVTPEAFAAGLPAEFQSLFKPGEAGDVILPLHEVLKNLPGASLRMREDQEVQDTGGNFATPFSAKAEEDAKRFKVAGPAAAPTIPAPKPLAVEEVAQAPAAPTIPAPKPFALEPVAEAPAAPVTPAPVTPITPTSPAPVSSAAPKLEMKPVESLARNPLQVALDTDEKLDAKGVVAEVNKLDGIKASAFMFGDGLSLAGSLPPEYETDGLCAMAPSLMQRIENHMVETKLGALRGMTLTCVKGAVTFFMHENLCLAALHSGGDLTTEVREKLSRIVHELSHKYSHHPV